jgi:hypothetical protein
MAESIKEGMRIFLMLVLALPLIAEAGQRKPPAITLRLHAEAKESEGASFVTEIQLKFPNKKIFVRKVPFMTERDIKSIFPFTADDGTLGCTFRLGASGSQRVDEHTTSARDTIVVALINGRVGSAMRVDRRITDGVVTIPTGFLPEEILALQALHPTIGKEREFEKQRREAEKSLHKMASRKTTPKPTPKPTN